MPAVRLVSDETVHLGCILGLAVGISSHLGSLYSHFYLLFRSVKKFSLERKKLVFSRVDTHLTHHVSSSQAFLRLTRSSPVPYTKLVSSDATHTLLHDPNKTIFGLACLARQISGPTILSVCDALEMSRPVLLLTAVS